MIARASGLSAARTARVTLLTVPPTATREDFALLSATERARAERFVVEPARAAFVTARGAIRRLLARELHCDPSDIRIGIDPLGRPFLEDQADEILDFNLSHSGALIAVVIARGRRVGIDIEWHGLDRGLHELVAGVMGARETEFLQTQRGPDFTRAFLDCWTRKEALVKAHGAGISFPLQSIDIPTLAAHLAARVELDGGSVWTVSTSAPHDAYSMSIALAGALDQTVVRGELDVAIEWQDRFLTA